MVEVVVTTGSVTTICRHAKLQSNHHHHQQTNTHFLQTGCPSLSPNQQCQSTEGKYGCNGVYKFDYYCYDYYYYYFTL